MHDTPAREPQEIMDQATGILDPDVRQNTLDLSDDDTGEGAPEADAPADPAPAADDPHDEPVGDSADEGEDHEN